MAKIVTSEYSMHLVMPQLEGMDDEEFFAFCHQNKHLTIERDENYQIIFMPPEGLSTAAMNLDIALAWQLEQRNEGRHSVWAFCRVLFAGYFNEIARCCLDEYRKMEWH